MQLLAVRNGLRELEIRARGVVALANLQLGGGETLLLHVIDSALEEARRRRLIASEAILLCCRLRCAEQLGKADVNTVRHAHSAGHYNQKLENAAALAKLNVAVAKVFQIAGKQDLAAESARRALALSLQPDGNCAFAITAGKSQQILSEVGATSDNLVIPVHISQRIQTLCDRIESSSFLS